MERNWTKEKAVTNSSDFNHLYIRKVIDGKSPFIFSGPTGTHMNLVNHNYTSVIWMVMFFAYLT